MSALKKERNELGYKVSNITLQRQNAQTVFKLQLTNEGSTDTGELEIKSPGVI